MLKITRTILLFFIVLSNQVRGEEETGRCDGKTLEAQLRYFDQATKGHNPYEKNAQLEYLYHINHALIEKTLVTDHLEDNQALTIFKKLSSTVFLETITGGVSLHHLLIIHTINATLIDMSHNVKDPLLTADDIAILVHNLRNPPEEDPTAMNTPLTGDFFKNAKEFLREIKAIFERGHRPYPFVSQDAIASYRDLNLSLTLDVPILGLPLNILCCYDGILNRSALIFLRHDLTHAKFLDRTRGLTPVRNQNVIDGFNILFTLIEANGGREHDHFVLFHLGHEHEFQTGEDQPLTSPLSSKKLDDAIKFAKDKTIRDINHLSEENMTSNFGYIISWEKTYSFVQLIVKYPIDFTKQFFTFREIIDPIDDGGFSHYNALFDIQEVMTRAGIPFPIWDNGLNFQAEGMAKTIQQVFDTFLNTYGPLLSQE